MKIFYAEYGKAVDKVYSCSVWVKHTIDLQSVLYMNSIFGNLAIIE